MQILENAILKLQALRDQLPDIAIQVVNDAHAEVEDKIIFQLREGMRGDGVYLPNYSPVSVAKFGKPFGPIKLYDRGDYYRKLSAKTFGNVLEIDDTDWKDPLLTAKYGPEIKQLSDKSLAELKEETFLPGILYEVNKRLSA